MRITTAEIHDYKRVRDVELTPAADASLIILGGKNRQGKSSILDALTAAIGGAGEVPTDPIRHGAKKAQIIVTLSTGVTIERVITNRGTQLEVRTADGQPVKSPQAMLNDLIGARFLDPSTFLRLDAKGQRAQLMKLIPNAERITELNAKKESQKTRRTEIGRDLEKAKGEIARLKELDAKPGTPIDVAALVAEQSKLGELQRTGYDLVVAGKAAEAALGVAGDNVRAKRDQIQDLETRLAVAREDLAQRETVLAEAKAKHEDLEKKVTAAAATWKETEPRRAAIDLEIANAGEHNRAVFEAEAHVKRLAEAEAAAKKLDTDYDECTVVLEKIDARKAEVLAAAKLPIDGLTVTDDGVELLGVPFAQASGAEKLRVALAIAIAASPKLDDIWLRDAALFDDESLAMIAKLAGDAGKRVWLERVGTADPGAIVISDGQVVS